MKKKVAIVGFSESTRDLAPYEDPDYEIWACNHLYRFIPRADRWFEIHTLDELKIKYGPTGDWEGYFKWMQELPEGQCIYMAEANEQIPHSRALPIEELKARYYFLEELGGEPQAVSRRVQPRAVFKSTISYMLAMALEEGFTSISLYGIDMVLDFEYGFQRQNLYYFIGWARGMGVDVIIPQKSALMKEADGMDLYGYEHRIDKYADLIAMLQKRITEYDRELRTLEAENAERVANIQHAKGALKLLEQIGENGGKMDAYVKANREAYQEENRANLDLLEHMKQLQGHRDEAHSIMTKVGFNNRGEQL